ncbi:MAG: aminopeptidase [Sphingobacteriaceae bacterium]
MRYMRLYWSLGLWLLFMVAAYNYELCIYLSKQGIGQINVLLKAQSFEDFTAANSLNTQGKKNIELINAIKKYSVDSLGYKPTNNFNKIYDQQHKPILWVITASEKYRLVPFEWDFPMIGKVSYKGFFEKELALKEKDRLAALGYDVGIRGVSAWSTLGWFNDPLLSSHISKKTGNFCNLLFHELFHATFYKADNINNNENLANFIAHKATMQFLKNKNDSLSLKEYLHNHLQREKLNQFLHSETIHYSAFLKTIKTNKNALILKQAYLIDLTKKIKNSGIGSEKLQAITIDEILNEQNAYFIDYMQYNSKQDSLEKAFNNFYKGSIKNMVRSLNP